VGTHSSPPRYVAAAERPGRRSPAAQ